jgi:hypothetical protein
LEQQRLEQEAQLARERWEFEERMRREREAQELARRHAEEAERQRQALLAARRAVQEVERSWRNAAVGDNRYVLRLRNGNPVGAQFQLRCYQVNGSYRSFPLRLAPAESTEIGWWQGWQGNFVVGEYCNAMFNEEMLWTVRLTA